MKKIALGQAITILANIGVIASLIFVGVQVRQEAAATRSATVLQLKSAWVDLNLTTMAYPELGEAFQSLRATGWGSGDRQARGTVGAFYRALAHNWSNAYYQFNNGTLDPEQWEAHLRELNFNARDELFQGFWVEWSYIYDQPFIDLMNERIAYVGATVE